MSGGELATLVKVEVTWSRMPTQICMEKYIYAFELHVTQKQTKKIIYTFFKQYFNSYVKKDPVIFTLRGMKVKTETKAGVKVKTIETLTG